MDPCENCKGKLLASCDCGPAAEFKKEIRALLAEGKSEDEIIQIFVDKHGEWVLAAPEKKGFNLLGYVLPFFLLLLGGGGLALFLKRAVGRTRFPGQAVISGDRVRLDPGAPSSERAPSSEPGKTPDLGPMKTPSRMKTPPRESSVLEPLSPESAEPTGSDRDRDVDAYRERLERELRALDR